jgi:hypothetical protein
VEVEANKGVRPLPPASSHVNPPFCYVPLKAVLVVNLISMPNQQSVNARGWKRWPVYGLAMEFQFSWRSKLLNT